MTSKEIKLELAKVALVRCNYTNEESLTTFMHNLYNWIVFEEHETQEENETEVFNYNNTPIKEVVSYIENSGKMGSTYATKLNKAFRNYEIYTVGDLLSIGERYLARYGSIGKGSISHISDALSNLYGITKW